MPLYWQKPAKARSTAEHNEMHSSDSVPGTYASNMSDEDFERWRAKKVGGEDPRVEIRTGGIAGANVVLIVRSEFRPDPKCPRWHTLGQVSLSLNGTAQMTFGQVDELYAAVQEARAALQS
jgi:hypothetical protein